MKDAIKQVLLPHEASEAHCKIVIKLTGDWEEKTVENLERLIAFLFKRDSHGRAKLIKVVDGSITVTFLFLSTAQSLIDEVQNKIQFIQYLGIFQIIINDDIIIKREEDIKFTFEDSLLHAINHIDSHAEYENVALLLIELKIPLNYKITDGQTALMLASQGGHIEIFKSLLQNGADPFVQLPANKGYIGLNYLACTALSQHIYKSIGGEKIIPQDNTSVEDMLEMAVKERGVSIYKFWYSPFIYIVKNKIKEKCQWLQDCFHVLDSSFLGAAINILTSKALVTEEKQKFQSYIREDVTCENAHQLVQLLQPHYSFLKVDLFTIPCTITEPIKEQVEEYNTNLKMFKDTTSLLELAMMTRGMQCPDGVGYSLILLKLYKSWCSRTIAELNEVENFNLSSFLTLFEIQCGTSNLICSYLMPQLHTKALKEAVSKQGSSLCEIGIFEVTIDGVPIANDPALQAIQNIDLFHVIFGSFLDKDDVDSDHVIAASATGDFSTVELLLSKDPDINTQNDKIGDTALIAASRFGHSQVVELLLSKDPDINIQDNNGWTALIAASVSGHHEVVELLLSKNPDINIQSNVGETALMAAGCYGHHQVIELLLSKDLDINIQDKNGATALMYASGNGHHQVVELLLSKDPDIDIKKNDGGTALIAASANGHHQAVKLLLSKDPDINSQDDDRQTALMGASANGHHQVVELLLSKNPDINIQDKDGVTALMYASYFGHHQVVELLLSESTHHGASLLKSHPNHTHLVDGKEFHSLVVAALFNNFDAVTILVEECDITPEHIISAFTASCYEGHSSMIIHLSQKITTLSNSERKLLEAAAKGDLGTLISMIFDFGMSPDTPLVAGITPLMIAASCGHAELVDALIQTGADVNKRNDEGMNALDIMNEIESDRSDTKELLITNTPAGEPDPVSNNNELTNKKSSTFTVSIKSIFYALKSFMMKAYNPSYAKQQEMTISSKVWNN
uniref:Uncharacterized protein n=1 Tax=Amphimedon queenslandica TaxID=400682 RepID=A0A1X7TQP5_AMPQE